MPCGLGHPLRPADASEGRRSVDGRVCFGRGGCRGPARPGRGSRTPSGHQATPLSPLCPLPQDESRRQYILRPTLGLRSEGLESKAIDKAGRMLVPAPGAPAPAPVDPTRRGIRGILSSSRRVECRRILSYLCLYLFTRCLRHSHTVSLCAALHGLFKPLR